MSQWNIKPSIVRPNITVTKGVFSLDSVYVLPTGCGNINESRQGTGRPGAGKPHLIHKARH